MVVGVADVPPEVVVFALIGIALVLFVSEVIPNDVTAIGIVVTLAALEPVGLTPREAISGFSNPATITIVAMYMLSAGIQNTGIVQRLGLYLAEFTRGDEGRALAATVGTTGPIAGFINNTPVVAVFIPMITDLAKESNISPSKLLLPLSYAAILGGTLTLIGTSTNILASDFSRQLLPEQGPIGMLEFTPLGIVVLAVGLVYLLTVGKRLTPARIPVEADLIEEFDMENHLTQVRVREDSPIVGIEVDAIEASAEGEQGQERAVTVLQIRRDVDGERKVYAAPYTDQQTEVGDTLVVNGTLQAVNRFRDANDLRQLPREAVTEATFEDAPTKNRLVKAVVPDTSTYVGETIAQTRIEKFHRTTVLAIRRKGELFRTELDDVELDPGDLLLARMPPESIDYFTESGDLLVTDERAYEQLAATDVAERAPLSPKAWLTVGIMALVVATAALNVLPIVIAALGGVFAMIVTGCLSPSDAYDAVSWNVIFLLAGVIPLGLAMEQTGGAALLAELLVSAQSFVPLLLMMLLFYVLTGLLANVITPVATVVLMIPVAVDAAIRMDANAYAFLLVVMFSSATSFMTPVGYQTNLMVYGPGGYRFSDFLRVGAPLQLLLAVVTTLGIALIWGIR